MSSWPSARDRSQAFWRGATRPSLGAVVIAIVVLALSLVSTGLIVTPEFVAGPMGRYLNADDLDTHARATRMVLGLEPEERPLIVVLGASLMVRTVDEDELAAIVEKRTGTRPRLLHLAIDAANTWEMAALLDYIPDGARVVVVVGLSYGVMAHGVDAGPGVSASLATVMQSPKLGFVSNGMDAEARLAGISPPFRTGIYAIDNREFLLNRRYQILRNLLRGAPEYGEPLDAPWMKRVNDPEVWKDEIESFPRVAGHYHRHKDVALGVIQRAAGELRARTTASFVLVEPPVNPRWADTELGPEFFPAYRADLSGFAAANDMSFVVLTDEAALERADFVDYEGHIGNRPARSRCTKTLAARVAEHLR